MIAKKRKLLSIGLSLIITSSMGIANQASALDRSVSEAKQGALQLRAYLTALDKNGSMYDKDSSVVIDNNSIEAVTQLVDLPKGEYDVIEASNMIKRLSHIPSDYLVKLKQKNSKITLTNGKITDVPEYSYLRGVVPRGWEKTGKTWDDVPGLGGRTVVARIGYSNPGRGHSTLNLEMHETAHTLDSMVFGNISKSSEFSYIFSQERYTLGNINYLGVYQEEFFAEAFAYYYLSDETNEKLKNASPKTYDFFKTLESKYN